MYQIVSSEMRVRRPRAGTAVIEVIGEHDMATKDEAGELFARLIAENELVVIDLSETQFIDSSFLNNLAKAQRAANKSDHIVLLQIGTEPIVNRLLEITGFLTHFDHVSSREEALAWAN